MKTILASMLALGCSATLMAVHAQAPPSGLLTTISLGPRHGQVTPVRQGFTHTGGGNIDVAQPAPDTVVITMTGVAVAGAHPCKDSLAALHFDLTQEFEINFEKPEVKKAKLTLEGRVIGLLRSHPHGGSAQEGPGVAAVSVGPIVVVSLALPPHTVSCGENVSINDRDGPVAVPVTAGKFTLHQAFDVSANHPHSLKPCKAASAEFAPEQALDPLWISYWEPFHGAAKKDFGFQITLKVAP
jgi:hypothetical protein